ncbi:MAG TPA: DMT family transporter, partial [Sediminibacterium sp.]|nr:DMT family transporter [Sediminibacterium sp.]
MPEKQKAIAAVLLGNFFFGTSVIAVKHISPSLIAPMGLTCIRVLSGTLLFWAVYLTKPERMRFTGRDFGRLVLCALTGIALNQSFSVRGMSLTSPIHASLLVLTTPIVITFLAAWFLKESLNLLKLLGLALGIGGGALLVFSRDLSAVPGQNQTMGDSFVIMGAVSYAFYVVGMRPLIRHHPTKHILPCVFLFGAFFTLPLGW